MAGNADLGKEFASVLSFRQDGKAAKAPTKGAYSISMRAGMSFAGDPAKALLDLQAAFPACTFDWEKAAANQEGSAK